MARDARVKRIFVRVLALVCAAAVFACRHDPAVRIESVPCPDDALKLAFTGLEKSLVNDAGSLGCAARRAGYVHSCMEQGPELLVLLRPSAGCLRELGKQVHGAHP